MIRKIPILRKRKIDRTVKSARNLSIDILSPAALIQGLRQRLGMSQTQLAKRAGMDQSHLGRIERGRLDPQLSTLEKIFKALFCDLVILAKPSESLEQILRKQAEKVARLHVQHVLGTMALEKQLPHAEASSDMIREEQERLLRDPSPDLWNE